MDDFNPSHTAKILSGTALAASILPLLITQVERLKQGRGRAPRLAAVLVGDHPASHVYVTAKQKACKKIGMDFQLVHLLEDISQNQLINAIASLNIDATIDGVIIQLPLPNRLDSYAALNALDPKKDVDGLTPYNLGLLMSKRPGFVPCTPLGCMDLIISTGVDIAGKQAVVLGRSILVGRPMALLLEQANATVTVVHSASKDVMEICKSADILVAAIGKPGYVTGDFVKPGAVVIDVGITRDNNTLFGDVDSSVAKVAGWLTPVPGGVGPMTIAMLLSNTLKAAATE